MYHLQGYIGTAILATAGIAALEGVSETVTAAKALQELGASALLALLAIVALGFAFYTVNKLHVDMQRLISELKERPCIRKPAND